MGRRKANLRRIANLQKQLNTQRSGGSGNGSSESGVKGMMIAFVMAFLVATSSMGLLVSRMTGGGLVDTRTNAPTEKALRKYANAVQGVEASNAVLNTVQRQAQNFNLNGAVKALQQMKGKTWGGSQVSFTGPNAQGMFPGLLAQQVVDLCRAANNARTCREEYAIAQRETDSFVLMYESTSRFAAIELQQQIRAKGQNLAEVEYKQNLKEENLKTQRALAANEAKVQKGEREARLEGKMVNLNIARGAIKGRNKFARSVWAEVPGYLGGAARGTTMEGATILTDAVGLAAKKLPEIAENLGDAGAGMATGFSGGVIKRVTSSGYLAATLAAVVMVLGRRQLGEVLVTILATAQSMGGMVTSSRAAAMRDGISSGILKILSIITTLFMSTVRGGVAAFSQNRAQAAANVAEAMAEMADEVNDAGAEAGLDAHAAMLTAAERAGAAAAVQLGGSNEARRRRASRFGIGAQ